MKRHGKRLLLDGAIFVTLVAAVLTAYASPAQQPCTSQGSSTDMSMLGNPRQQSQTTRSNCDTRWVQVGPWIDGIGFDCSGENCTDTTNAGNAVEQAFASTAQYGTFTGHAIHRFSDDEKATWSNLPNSNVTLDAGLSPEEECEAANGQWDPQYEVCDWSSDPPGSPLIINVGRSSAYRLTSAADGVLFDLNGDGIPEKVAWTESDSTVAFLAIDRNGDGQITSGRELFGNFTDPRASNGFLALRILAMQTNGGVLRGSVSANDPLFADLLLWTDSNHNGISEAWELTAARDLISDIGLGYQIMPRRDGHGNLFRFRGWVHIRTAPGRNMAASAAENIARTRKIWDVFLTTER